MIIAFAHFLAPRITTTLCLAGFMVLLGLPTAGQHSQSDSVEVQHQAMQKLAFLSGRWSGPVTIHHGPDGALHLTQSEDVQYKLDGLVLLIEGQSSGADGRAQFSALATISFDSADHTYHIRAYNNGQYVDTAFTLLDEGFSWSFSAGPARIVNTMHRTSAGEWQETSTVAIGNAMPQPTVDMLLRRQP